MRRTLAAAAAAVALASFAQADELWNNGGFQTGTGDGFGGANTSSIEGPTYTSFGYNINNAAASPGGPFRVADDFIVDGPGWQLSSMRWYAYQTGSTTTSTITGAFVAIYDASPAAGGTLIAGDFTTNRLQASSWTGVYRVTATTLTNNTRPIMENIIDMSWAPLLAAGDYWVAVGLTGSLASGPWANPVVPADQQTDNAVQHSTDANSNPVWLPIDGNGTAAGTPPQDMPFKLDGVRVPEPASLAGLALLALGLRRRR